MAAELGRPQSLVAKYESQVRRLDIAEYPMIAQALGWTHTHSSSSNEDWLKVRDWPDQQLTEVRRP
jgi:hypothetical protein